MAEIILLLIMFGCLVIYRQRLTNKRLLKDLIDSRKKILEFKKYGLATIGYGSSHCACSCKCKTKDNGNSHFEVYSVRIKHHDQITWIEVHFYDPELFNDHDNQRPLRVYLPLSAFFTLNCPAKKELEGYNWIKVSKLVQRIHLEALKKITQELEKASKQGGTLL